MTTWGDIDVGLLHGLIRRSDREQVGQRLDSVDGVRPILVDAGGLTAVLTLWPKGGDGAPEIATAFADPGRAAALALVHHDILAAALTVGDVLPVRIGSVYGQVESVRQRMIRDGADFAAALDRVAQAIELGVRLSMTADAGASAAVTSPAGSGRAYLRQIADADRARRTQRQDVQGLRNRLVEGLRSMARSTVLRPVSQQSAATRIVGDVALLVSRTEEIRVREWVSRQQIDATALGVSLTVTGPWPPYSFAVLPELMETTP